MNRSALQASVSAAVGTAVEITVRGLRDFTFSADGNVLDALTAFVKTLPGLVSVDGRFDAECDMTCVYFSV